MAKKIQTVSLLDIIPPNLQDDKKIIAAAKSIDSEMQKVTAAINECIHLARIDELPEKVLDLLAWQWHVDFYEPIKIDISKKRELIKQSIAWHRMKGTPAAVENVVSAAFEKSKVEEWYEYGGKPFFFKVVTEDVTTDTEILDEMKRAINTVKNTRSWLEKIEFIMHLQDSYGGPDDTGEINIIAEPSFHEDCPYGDVNHRTLDGSWMIAGPTIINGSWIIDGSVKLDGVVRGAVQLEQTMDDLSDMMITMDGIDENVETAMPLNGSWILNGKYQIGTRASPVDLDGEVSIIRSHRLDGTWQLNGGDINFIDGSIQLDGRADMTGGGIQLHTEVYNDELSGMMHIGKIEKVLPYEILHPHLHDDVSIMDDETSIKIGINGFDDDATHHHMNLDGSWIIDGSVNFGKTLLPADAGILLQIVHAVRMDGTWMLDGGAKNETNGSWMLDGSRKIEGGIQLGRKIEILQ